MTTSMSCLERMGIKSPNYDNNEGILLQRKKYPVPIPSCFKVLDFILTFPALPCHMLIITMLLFCDQLNPKIHCLYNCQDIHNPELPVL